MDRDQRIKRPKRWNNDRQKSIKGVEIPLELDSLFDSQLINYEWYECESSIKPLQ